MTTKILALTDALGNLVRFVLLPGQRFDTVGVAPLIEGLAFDALIADKAFDSNTIIAALDARGATMGSLALTIFAVFVWLLLPGTSAWMLIAAGVLWLIAAAASVPVPASRIDRLSSCGLSVNIRSISG